MTLKIETLSRKPYFVKKTKAYSIVDIFVLTSFNWENPPTFTKTFLKTFEKETFVRSESLEANPLFGVI